MHNIESLFHASEVASVTPGVDEASGKRFAIPDTNARAASAISAVQALSSSDYRCAGVTNVKEAGNS
jgi:hypothetical protein